MKKIEKILQTTTILWVVLLFILAVQPEQMVLYFLHKSSRAAAAHSMVYFVLASLIYAKLFYQRRLSKINMSDWKISFYALFSCLTCGILTELIQFFTKDRTPDVADVYSDVIGGIVAICAFFLITRLVLLSHILASRFSILSTVKKIKKVTPVPAR